MLFTVLGIFSSFGLTMVAITMGTWGALGNPDLDFFRRMGALTVGCLAAWSWAYFTQVIIGVF